MLSTKNSVVIVILSVAALGGVTAGGYYYLQYQHTQQMLKNPTLAAQLEAQNTIDRVSKLMDLPKDETPTIATVTDYNKVKSQPFFAKAQNGDRVLIYTKAKEAILYRPTDEKIITVAPVNIGNAQPSVSQVIAPKVALYNGTNITGLTKTIEQSLMSKVKDITVVSKGNASKADYTQTVVIDLTGKQTAASKQIASVLNGEVGTLPVEETKPENADILVIVGQPRK